MSQVKLPRPVPCKASIKEIIDAKKEPPRAIPNHQQWLASFNAQCRNEEKRIAAEKKKK